MCSMKLSLFLLVFILTSSRIIGLQQFSTLRSKQVLPVFQNVLPSHGQQIVNLVQHRPECFISIGHPEAMTSLKQLCTDLVKIGSACSVGASSVDTVQEIQGCYEAGAQFISCEDTKIARFIASLGLPTQLPVISGVHNANEAQQAIDWGTSALHFISTQILPIQLQTLLTKLHCDNTHNIRVCMSNVDSNNINDYITAGVTDITLKLDLNTLSMNDIIERMNVYDVEISKYVSSDSHNPTFQLYT